MTEDFFDFITDTSNTAFLKSQRYVMEHKNYDAYSDDFNQIIDRMNAGDFDAALRFNSVNVILSPRAHLAKRHAAEKKGDQNAAKAEEVLAFRILENLCLTGDGSKSQPYRVTQLSDERDMLEFMGEKFLSQSLQKTDTGSYDCITTESGKVIYFDITNCLKSVASLTFDEMMAKLSGSDREKPTRNESKTALSEFGQKKKWWKFW